MYDEGTLLRLVGLIYDAAADPARWPQFLNALAEIVNGHAANLSYIHGDHFELFSATARMDPSFMSEYRDYYMALDPLVKVGKERGLLQPGVVELGEALLSSAELTAGEFFNDFARRYGFFAGFTAVVAAPGDAIGAAISVSQLARGTFDAAERNLMIALAPHVERALTLQKRLEGMETLSGRLADAFDAVPFAAILVDQGGKPVVINRAGRAVLSRRDGLAETRDGLVASRPQHTRALHTLIEKAVLCTEGDGIGAGGTLLLPRPSFRRPLHVVVTPLRRENQYGPSGQRAWAAVFVTDPEERPHIESKVVQHLFGLTPSEARVASLLAGGANVAQVGERLHVTDYTTRTHLKHLFDKTGASSQSELVRLILTSVAVLQP